MNILFIGTTDILGGAARVSWDIRSALKEQGHTTSVFVADKRSSDLFVKIIPRQMWRKYLGFLFATDDLLSSDWILKTSEYKNADIVHCHNLHGRYFNLSTLQKMSTEKPVIWTLHDEWAITPHCVCTFEGVKMKNGLFVCPDKNTPPRILWDNTRYLSWRKNSIYKKSKLHIVTPSRWLKERVKKTILGLQDFRLIHNGIDTNIFKRSDKNIARQKLGLPLDKKIVLFLADDAKNNIWKGWKYTEEVIKRYKDDRDLLFISVGNHTLYPDEGNVRYISHIDKKEEIALYYSAADILLFTSIAENFPLVILEAMGCGLPIVSFDVGGVKEAVTHKENGYIATYRDTKSLIEGMDYILNLSNDEIKNISESSIKKIQNNFTKDLMVGGYIKLYEELIEKECKIKREKIIKKIIEAEKLRPLGRIERLMKVPVRTFFYYILAVIGHIKPYKISFKTLWGTKMVSYLPEGNTFYYYGYCEANLTNFLLRFLKEGDTILDVGAHVGFYSMLSSELVGEKGRVYSFEPTPWTYEILKQNTEKLINVTLNNNAVSNKKEIISFRDYGYGYGAYNTAHKEGAILKKKAETINIETVVLDEYCKGKNIVPDFIKLDAEGYEYAILQGMVNILEVNRPVVTLEVAGGEEWSGNCKKSIEFLVSKKYKPYEMGLDGFISSHIIKDNYEYDNLLFVPEEKNITL